MAIKVFISHSTSPDPNKKIELRLLEQLPAHAEFRNELCARLAAEKDIECFVDDHTRTGDQWREVLFGEMDECNAAVILVNELALTCSDWVDTEAKILCWRAWVEKKNFRLIIVPFGGITPERIARHQPWAAIAPGEIQMVPRGGNGLDIAQAGAVKAVLDDIVATLRSLPDDADPAASSWIVSVLGSFLANDPSELKRVARRLGFPVQGNRQVSKREVAKLLYDLGPEAMQPFLELRPSSMTRTDLEFLLRVLKTNWIDPRSSAPVLAFCAKGTRRVFALNAALHNFTPQAYVDQLLHSREFWPVIPVDDTKAYDNVIEQIRVDLIDHFRATLVLSLRRPEEAKPNIVDEHLNKLFDDRIGRGKAVFVALSSAAADSHDLIAEIHRTYPSIRVIVCTAQQPPSMRLPDIDTLEPEINLDVEAAAFSRFWVAHSLLPPQ